jgi:hypothetical protein
MGRRYNMKYTVKLTDKKTVRVTLDTRALRLCDEEAIKDTLEALKGYDTDELRSLASLAIASKEETKPTATYRLYNLDELIIDHIEITRENENILPWLCGLAISRAGDCVTQIWDVQFNLHNVDSHLIRAFNSAE